MKILIIFFLFLTIQKNTETVEQFGFIEDKDGYSNVRSSAEKGNNIVDKVNNGQVVFCLETEGNWAYIDYTKNKTNSSGLVYKDKIQLISKYEKIKLVNSDKNKFEYKKDSISITIEEQKFSKTKHKYSYNKINKNMIEKIDGKAYWGTDGNVPTTEYKSIKVNIGKAEITLPKIALENLYEVSFHNTEVFYNRAKDILYIKSANSDGAGSYYVLWKIENQKYKERHLAYGF